MKPIPVVASRNIAEQYCYDQVVIIARKVGEAGGEHVTTYGCSVEHCDAAQIGDFLKQKVMGWVMADAIPSRVQQLMNERDGEREAREKIERAYRKQDAAMGVLFDRLNKAGVDCSDLIP